MEQSQHHNGTPVKELERQVERGSMFTQAVFQESFTRPQLGRGSRARNGRRVGDAVESSPMNLPKRGTP